MVDGEVTCGGQSGAARRACCCSGAGPAGSPARRDAQGRFVLLARRPFPEPRHIWWNFVSSSKARIEQAKRDWRERRGRPDGPFPLVPGDEHEFIPLP